MKCKVVIDVDDSVDHGEVDIESSYDANSLKHDIKMVIENDLGVDVTSIEVEVVS
jgi:hypothetical protein